MQKNSDLYFEGQNEKSKLVYSVGLLWGKINSTLDEVLGEFNLNVSKFNVLMIIKHIGGYDMENYTGVGALPSYEQMQYIIHEIRSRTGNTHLSFVGEKSTGEE